MKPTKKAARDAGFLEGSQAALSALDMTAPKLMTEERMRRAWLAFSDDVGMPERLEGDALSRFAEAAFAAGYVTAIGHIGHVIGTLSSPLDVSAG